jgi:pimeloyl-ACP methyl ester carboxylesterase
MTFTSKNNPVSTNGRFPHRRQFAVACFILLAAVFVQTPLRADEAEKNDEARREIWFGTLELKGIRTLRFALHLEKQGEQWSGILESLDEGEQSYDLANVEFSETGMKFDVPKPSGSYEGKFSDKENRVVAGKWKQSGKEFELSFSHVKEIPQRKAKAVWKGTLDAFIQKLDVAFIELESGEVVFESISQKSGGLLAKDESTEEEVVYKVPAVNGTFKGKYAEDKNKIEGKWTQGFVSLTLVLKRVELKDLKTKKISRPQSPKAPYPYESRDITFDSKNKDVKLAGTVTLPKGKVYRAVVLISGSGPQDRNQSLLDHKPFLVIADHFARHGIATLRFDDRGIGKSKGDFATATSFDFADDAEGALLRLRSMPELKDVPVGLCGHSEGGLVAPIVAARNEKVSFVVMLAGIGVNGEAILYNQLRLILKAEGSPEEEIEQAAKFQRILLKAVIKHGGLSAEEIEDKIHEELKMVLTKEELAKPELPAEVKSGVSKVATPWFRTFLTLEPKIALGKTRCPVLALNGEKDTQVDPILNFPAIRAALDKAGNDQYEIVEYPGLNHLFQSCKTGAVSEYQQIEETFNLKPLEKMTSWILELKLED